MMHDRKKFYKTTKWRDRSRYIANSNNYICNICNKPITGKYIVDHIQEIRDEDVACDNQNVLYAEENLQLLCISCHNRKTFSKRNEFMKKNKFDFEKRKEFY